MTRLYDAVVVGTGAAGLTAGLRLQREGFSVLLLEAGKAFGGMLNPFSRKGFDFDVGVHYLGELGPGEALREIFDSLGLSTLRFRALNPDCIDRYVFNGYEARLMAGAERWCTYLASEFPRERDAIHRFGKLLNAVDLMVQLYLRRAAPHHASRLLPRSLDLLRLFREPHGKVLEHFFRDPMLRAVLSAPTGLLGVAPGRASALLTLCAITHYLKGSYYPLGGSHALRDAYVSALTRQGAELRRNSAVERIIRASDGTFVLNTVQQETFRARSVVSNADMPQTLALLEGIRPNWLSRSRARRSRPSLSLLAVYLATDLDLTRTGLTDAMLWHYGSPDIDATYEEMSAGRLPERPMFLLSSSTLKDPGSRTDGRHTLQIISYLSGEPYRHWFSEPTRKRGPAYEAHKQALTARLTEQAERYVPGLRKHVLLQDSATPATAWSFVRTEHGGIFGPENSPDQSPLRRMLPVIGIPGLFLAGASVGGPGIFSCVVSGLTGAQQCAAYLRGRLRQTSRPDPRATLSGTA